MKHSASCNRWPAVQPNRDAAQLRRLAGLTAAAAVVIALTSSHPASAEGLGIAESDATARRHRDFAGKPCLQTEGIARPLASNPRILNHAVSLDNHCNDAIKVRVCYYRSDDCTEVSVPGHARKEQIIGVFPAMQLFRYEVKEQF